MVTPWRLIVMFMIAVAAAQADLLLLADGESLSGNALRIKEGVLVFRTSLAAGQMMVPMDTVKNLSTDGNLVITLKDNQTVYGRLSEKDGAAQLLPIDGSAMRPIELTQIVEALPIPRPPQNALESKDALDQWKASLETGYQQRSQNQSYADIYSRLNVSRQDPTSQFQANLFLERADTGDFPRLLRADAEIQRAGQGAQPFIALQAERDTDIALNLRTGLTLGLRKPLLENDPQALNARLGVNAAFEDWNASLQRDARNWLNSPGNNPKTNAELNLHLGLRYAQSLFGRTTLTGDIALLPALSQLGDLRAYSETALAIPVTDRLQLRLNLRIDFDNQPEYRAMDKWGASVGAGIHVDF